MNVELEIVSPCISVCELDDENICIGCKRSKTEISQWSKMSRNQRLELLKILHKRRRDAGKVNVYADRPRRRRKTLR